jgi:hypothetical protein
LLKGGFSHERKIVSYNENDPGERRYAELDPVRGKRYFQSCSGAKIVSYSYGMSGADPQA